MGTKMSSKGPQLGATPKLEAPHARAPEVMMFLVPIYDDSRRCAAEDPSSRIGKALREDQAEKASKVLPPGKCRRQTTS